VKKRSTVNKYEITGNRNVKKHGNPNMNEKTDSCIIDAISYIFRRL